VEDRQETRHPGRRRSSLGGRAVAVGLLSALLLHLLRPPGVLILPEPNPPVFPGAPVARAPAADLRLLEVTTRRAWKPWRIVVTYEEVRTDPFLWATMFFRDWDRVPEPLRDEGLARMWAGFGHLIDEPRSWSAMTPDDWDRVPQPIRAMTFMNMVARWEACLGVAKRFALPQREVVSRLRAVTMAESWFEHRAFAENPDGTTDLGLAAATTATRHLLRWRAAAGLSGFRFEDEEYFDPLKASRVLVYWFSLMLEETSGDLGLATRAYNVGSGHARQGGGLDYLAGVLRIEERYIAGTARSPTWRYLRARSREPRLDQQDAERTSPCPSDEPD
jgi:hypothetical protein